ncbi:hypothetical protein TSA6c_16995 [Azospirillum sp. TSA6c]|uniref:hypothetical protein n=1 Tax=Azospirillum sp. TSA6c TaxID=709813 RepID=UPI000D60FF5B|nr:hypothetical protein [Azospirillum sp. TSA6c]PWC48133.1 hypothetical protein TSA6c_16995 [Azospirillum sp. TSA6c]
MGFLLIGRVMNGKGDCGMLRASDVVSESSLYSGRLLAPFSFSDLGFGRLTEPEKPAADGAAGIGQQKGEQQKGGVLIATAFRQRPLHLLLGR